ncbi:MAG: hypothetical protein KDD04_08345 [Sinomicrobium sp.]|nr:hypothetical protein [Sinomicrobium sp.]
MLEKKDNDNYEGDRDTTKPEAPENPGSSTEENSGGIPGAPVEEHDTDSPPTDHRENGKETGESSEDQDNTEENRKIIAPEIPDEALTEKSSSTISEDPLEEEVDSNVMTDRGEGDGETDKSPEDREHTKEEVQTVTAENEGETPAEEGNAISAG